MKNCHDLKPGDIVKFDMNLNSKRDIQRLFLHTGPFRIKSYFIVLGFGTRNNRYDCVVVKINGKQSEYHYSWFEKVTDVNTKTVKILFGDVDEQT